MIDIYIIYIFNIFKSCLFVLVNMTFIDIYSLKRDVVEDVEG